MPIGNWQTKVASEIRTTLYEHDDFCSHIGNAYNTIVFYSPVLYNIRGSSFTSRHKNIRPK